MTRQSNRLRHLTLIATASLIGTLLVGHAWAQQPVIPGAAGFGIETPAGRGGQIIHVTNLNDSGPGSLRDCATAPGSRICVFDVSGVIELESNLQVTEDFVTIAGQTAPAPGIMLRGAPLQIQASDVLVQHIAVRVGDGSQGAEASIRDALKINAPYFIKNIVIDHCSFSWSTDEAAQVWNDWDNITISNSIISEPLNESLHNKGEHGYAMLVDTTDGQISVIGNLIAHSKNRNPRVGASRFVFVNNVVYNYGQGGMSLFNTPGLPSYNSIVGNVYLKGPDSSGSDVIRLDSNSNGPTNAILSNSRIYLSDNQASGATSDPWSIVNNGSGVSRSQLEWFVAPTWPTGLQAVATENDAVLDRVLANVGSRPAQRDRVDANVISHVRNGTGEIINCVSNDGSEKCSKNAGGWPLYAQNTHVPAIPANPNGDSDGDGYTNVEEWLHSLAAGLEGSASALPAPAPDTPKPNPPQITGID